MLTEQDIGKLVYREDEVGILRAFQGDKPVIQVWTAPVATRSPDGWELVGEGAETEILRASLQEARKDYEAARAHFREALAERDLARERLEQSRAFIKALSEVQRPCAREGLSGLLRAARWCGAASAVENGIDLGQVELALQESLRGDPSDPITLALLRAIEEVREDEREEPPVIPPGLTAQNAPMVRERMNALRGKDALSALTSSAPRFARLVVRPGFDYAVVVGYDFGMFKPGIVYQISEVLGQHVLDECGPGVMALPPAEARERFGFSNAQTFDDLFTMGGALVRTISELEADRREKGKGL